MTLPAFTFGRVTFTIFRSRQKVRYKMEISQIIVNSLIRGAELSLLAIGLTMVYDILGFANFAHTEFAAFGAFLGFTFNSLLGINLLLSVVLAALLTGLIGILLDMSIFEKLRARNAKTLTMMIITMGMGIAIRNISRLIWTSSTKNFPMPLLQPLKILGARITRVQLGILFIAAISMVAFHLLLHHTKFGKALRAISDNKELARASAIDSAKMVQWMWFVAYSYAVIGGTMLAIEHLLYPRLGFDIIIPVFCAAILGGIGNPYGAVLGALTLGFAENVIISLDFGPLFSLGGLFDVGSLQLSTGYKPAISFMILILVLLIKPTGILGEN